MSPVTPPVVTAMMDRIAGDPQMHDGMKEMMRRKREFSTPTAARLAGIAMVPAALDFFNDNLDGYWAGGVVRDADEIIIGGGFHAAVYAATRRSRMKAPPPLVIDGGRIGGAFAVSRSPSFYLNSRNRPGDLGIPGQGAALNVIPHAPIQPSDLSSAEYQRNSDLAYAIRTTLAMSANCLSGVWVTNVVDISDRPLPRRWSLQLSDDTVATCDRIILATGIGRKHRNFQDEIDENEKVMGFMDFMATMDTKFPLRGMKRVAVIGAGDSGRTAVEALVGQGPSSGWSVASVDYPEVIDWYGCAQDTQEKWEECNRTRYRNIGTALNGRVHAFDRAGFISGGLDVGYVDERPYDAVIVCTGFDINEAIPGVPGMVWMTRGNRKVGQTNAVSDDSVIRIGPTARIPVTSVELNAIGSAVPENSTALFRYAERTALAAATMPAPVPVVVTAPVPNRTILGSDRYGRSIRAGDTVRYEGTKSVALGLCDGEQEGRGRPFIGLQRDGGEYYVNGEPAFGLYAYEVELVEVDGLGYRENID